MSMQEKKEPPQEIRILKEQQDHLEVTGVSIKTDECSNYRVVYKGTSTLKRGTRLFSSLPVVYLPQQLPFQMDDLRFSFVQNWSTIKRNQKSMKTLMWAAVGIRLLEVLNQVEYKETKNKIDRLYPRTEAEMKLVLNVRFTQKFQLSEQVVETFPIPLQMILAKYIACHNRGFSNWPVSGLLYVGLSSFMNHSCEPNCCYFIDPEKDYLLTIRAFVPILPGEELTYTYTAESLCLLPEKRQEKLFNFFGHKCTCSACLRFTVTEGFLFYNAPNLLGNFFCHYCGKLEDSSTDIETQLQMQLLLIDEKEKKLLKNKNKTMKCCGRCKRIYYCSKNCQKSHWLVHKNACKRKGFVGKDNVNINVIQNVFREINSK